jgi:hypothetical protein
MADEAEINMEKHLLPISLYSLPCPSWYFPHSKAHFLSWYWRKKKNRWQQEEQKEEKGEEKIHTFPFRFFLIQNQR